ncbi:MAG TPA: hypothetical protein VHD34_09485, partial [Xanthobacteraceae bacterium]|nr:hypothetical protein [Xanthobacteraceae bacterium]
LVLAFSTAPVFAQADAKITPDGENGRYTMSPVDGGVMRLDTRTGQVSLCRKKQDSWTCEAVADDRAAYEKEIGRLQEKVAELEGELGRGKKDALKLPSDAEVDSAMKFFENILRRFKSMIENLQREDAGKPT